MVRRLVAHEFGVSIGRLLGLCLTDGAVVPRLLGHELHAVEGGPESALRGRSTRVGSPLVVTARAVTALVCHASQRTEAGHTRMLLQSAGTAR